MKRILAEYKFVIEHCHANALQTVRIMFFLHLMKSARGTKRNTTGESIGECAKRVIELLQKVDEDFHF